ncbi:unnamed protein product, partial [Trichogramma brassicae]
EKKVLHDQDRTEATALDPVWQQCQPRKIREARTPTRAARSAIELKVKACCDDARADVSKDSRRGQLGLVDFNAWSTEWGQAVVSRDQEARCCSMQSLHSMCLLLNTGSRSTFCGPQGGSVIDLTFASDTLSERESSPGASVEPTHRQRPPCHSVFEVLPAGNRRSNPSSGEPSQVERPARWTETCFGEMMSGVVEGSISLP